jgi:uncharacterized protein YoxC
MSINLIIENVMFFIAFIVVLLAFLVVARTIRSVITTEKIVGENNKMLRALLKQTGVTEAEINDLLKKEE